MADTPIIIKKKKSHGGHAHHGGSWKVAYADFVTAMMAFFMVMWIMGLSDDTRAQIQGYFNDPLGFIKNQPKLKLNISPPGSPATRGAGSGEGNDSNKGDEAQLKEIKKEIEEVSQKDSNLDALLKHVDMTVTPEGLRIEFVESTVATFFASGSAELLPSAKEFIKRIAPLIQNSKRPLIFEGHTDAVPYPSESYTNWDLSSDRANAFRRAMESFGVPKEQCEKVTGFAATQLKRPDKPYDVSNRRVSLLLPFKKSKDTKKDLPRDEFENRLRAKPVDIAPG